MNSDILRPTFLASYLNFEFDKVYLVNKSLSFIRGPPYLIRICDLILIRSQIVAVCVCMRVMCE